MSEASRGGDPAYVRIAKSLGDRIASGVYPEGSRLPSGPQLCADFGVSPMTARRALALLENQGMVSAIQGRGTFVRSMDLSRSPFHLDYRGGEWLDETADIRLLSASMIRADDSVVAHLGVEPGRMVVYLRRLVLHDDEPAMYHREYIIYDPRRPVVEAQLQLTSLHAFFDSGGASRFPRGDLTLTSVNLDADGAAALGEPVGSSALCLEHLFRDSDDTPVSWGRFLLRTGLFSLRAKLG